MSPSGTPNPGFPRGNAERARVHGCRRSTKKKPQSQKPRQFPEVSDQKRKKKKGGRSSGILREWLTTGAIGCLMAGWSGFHLGSPVFRQIWSSGESLGRKGRTDLTSAHTPPPERLPPLRSLLGPPVVPFYSPTAESFGVSAQIGSGVVRGGPEVRFHEGSTRVPPGFHQGSSRVPPGFHEGSARFCECCGVVRGGARTKKSTACCWGCHLSLFFWGRRKPLLEQTTENRVPYSDLSAGGPSLGFCQLASGRSYLDVGTTRILTRARFTVLNPMAGCRRSCEAFTFSASLALICRGWHHSTCLADILYVHHLDIYIDT